MTHDAAPTRALVEWDDGFVARFHAGDRRALEDCYRSCFDAVFGAVGRVVTGADRETLVHEVFARVLADESMRRRFEGGSLRAWLATVAKNHAVDFVRRRRREDLVAPDVAADLAGAADVAPPEAHRARTEARALVDAFRRDVLPAKWAPVFEARFLRQLSQREAAASLGMTRTTLAYQELRVRQLLKRFLLRKGATP